MIYIAPVLKESGRVDRYSRQGWQLNWGRLTESKMSFRWRLKVGSDWDLRMLTGNEFQTLGAENQKAWDPKDRLWWGTESWWELDERRDLVGSWCCKRSEKYGGRPVCKALKFKVASLNLRRHSIGSQWSCLRSTFKDSGDVRYCWYKTTRAAARWIHWRRAVCLSERPYRCSSKFYQTCITVQGSPC